LFVLLLNDLSLKYEFPSWVTGKLSDFTGLFLLAVFLCAFFPARRTTILVGCALFFTWWKSGLSTPFIHFCHTYLSLPVSRVIDYTDLTALFVLPVAFHISQQQMPATSPRQPALLALVSIISIFSFCFTSMPRHAMGYYSDARNEVSFYQTVYTRKTEGEFQEKLREMGIPFTIDSIAYYRVPGDFSLRTKPPNDSTFEWKKVPNAGDSILYLRRNEGAYYLLPAYTLDGEELKNIKLAFYQYKRQNEIAMKTFETSTYQPFLSDKLKRKYKRHFQKLFK